MPNEESKNNYINTDFSIGQMTESELKEIRDEYFYSIEDVKILNKSQQWILDNKSFISPDCCLQIVLKLKGIIDIKVIKNNLVKVTKNNPVLRTAFFIKDSERSLQVALTDRSPEVSFSEYLGIKKNDIYYLLEDVLALEQRRGFNLKKDRLLRVKVLRFSIDSYAMVVTFPQLIEDGWDMKSIFNGVFDNQEGNKLVAQMPVSRTYSFAKYMENRKKEEVIKAFEYWKKILHDAKAPILPVVENTLGLYERDSISIDLDEPLSMAIAEFANTNGRLIALFETAWGIMLQKYSGESDVAFGIVLANHNEDIENADFSNIINILPVRIKENPEERVGYVFKRQQVHLFIAKTYIGCSQKELEMLWPNCKDIFNHVLNFRNFYDSKSFTEVDFPLGVKIISINSYDDYKSDLIVYFRKQEEIIQVDFVYNRISFSTIKIENLINDFLAVLTQMVTKPNVKLSEIKLVTALDEVVDKREKERIFHMGLTELRKKELFRNLNDKEWTDLTKKIIVKEYIKDDVVLSEGQSQDSIYLIYDGVVEIRRSSEDGWSRKLGDLTFGNIISYNNLFEVKESTVTAKVISKKATIITIKSEFIVETLKNNFEFLKDIIEAITAQAELFQKLWLEITE